MEGGECYEMFIHTAWLMLSFGRVPTHCPDILLMGQSLVWTPGLSPLCPLKLVFSPHCWRIRIFMFLDLLPRSISVFPQTEMECSHGTFLCKQLAFIVPYKIW